MKKSTLRRLDALEHEEVNQKKGKGVSLDSEQGADLFINLIVLGYYVGGELSPETSAKNG
jgi:hypothetical protein